MLLIALFWGWMAAVSLGLGLGLLRGVKATSGQLPELLTTSPELLSISGLAVLSWLVAWGSFFLPISLAMQLGLSALAAGSLVAFRADLGAVLRQYGRGWRAAGAAAVGLAAAASALVLVQAAQPPIFPDAALYHAQFIQWLHRYPVVPGLGNLHGRLAFNSHLHLLTAFFSPAAPPGRGPAFQQTVNSFYLLLLTLYHVRRAGQVLRAGARPWLAGYYLGSLLLVLLVLRPWISSPLPDSTVAALGLLLLGVLLEKPRLPRSGLVWLTVLTATAVTFKASAAAFLLWPLAWALRQPARQWPQTLNLLAGVGLVVMLPWLGRNVVLSGYLVYPLAGGVGPLVREWAIPAQRLAADLAEIRLFARRPLPDWPLAAAQPVRQWFLPWWQQQALADRGLFILVLAGMAAIAGWAIKRALTQPRQIRSWLKRPGVQLYGLLLLASGSWFAAAPAFRFAYTYLIGAALLAPLLLIASFPWLRSWSRLGGWALGLLSLLYCLNGLRHELAKPLFATWPADYPAVPARVAGYLGPYPVREGPAPNGRCGNCPLPCTDELRPGVRLRGRTLRQGFKTAVAMEPLRAE